MDLQFYAISSSPDQLDTLLIDQSLSNQEFAVDQNLLSSLVFSLPVETLRTT